MHIIPRDIQNGMKVLDASGKELGHVDAFHFSENEDDPRAEPSEVDGGDREHNTSIIEQVAESLFADELPEELRDRLLVQGYARIKMHGVKKHRYVLPEQIDSSADNVLMLNVDEDALIVRGAYPE